MKCKLIPEVSRFYEQCNADLYRSAIRRAVRCAVNALYVTELVIFLAKIVSSDESGWREVVAGCALPLRLKC